MNRFSTMIDEHLETINDLDVSIQERIDWLERFDEEFDTKMVESGFGETLFTEKCKQFGIPLFKSGDGRTASERRFLSMMTRKIRTSGDEPNLDASDITKLTKVLAKVEIPLATQDQKIRIRDLRNMLVEARRENAYVPYFPYRIRRNMNQEEAEKQIQQLITVLDSVRDQQELRVEIEANSRQHTDGGE
jgi:hypothetical protein